MLVVSYRDTVIERYLNQSRAQLTWTTESEDVEGLKRRKREVSEIVTLKFELSGTTELVF